MFYGVDEELYNRYGLACNDQGITYSTVKEDDKRWLMIDQVPGRCNRPVKDSSQLFPGALCHRYPVAGEPTCQSHRPKPFSDSEMEEQFQELKEKHLNSPDLYGLDDELAAQKALIEILTTRISRTPEALTGPMMGTLASSIDGLGKVRDRILKQNKGKEITPNEINVFFAGVMSMMAVFVKPSDYGAFVRAIKSTVLGSDISNKLAVRGFGRLVLLELPEGFDFDGQFRQLAEDLWRMRGLPLENLSLLEERLQRFREDVDDDPIEDMSIPDPQPMDVPEHQRILR